MEAEKEGVSRDEQNTSARAEVRAALLRDLARVRGIQRRADDPRDEEDLRLEALPISLSCPSKEILAPPVGREPSPAVSEGPPF